MDVDRIRLLSFVFFKNKQVLECFKMTKKDVEAGGCCMCRERSPVNGPYIPTFFSVLLQITMNSSLG